MENVEFTDEEIREQLANLGYFDVSTDRLEQFRKDLQRLVERDRSSASSSWFTGLSSPSLQSDVSPISQPIHLQQSPTTKTSQRSLAMKPSLSRFQPHIPASPRETYPESPGLDDNLPLVGSAYPTPETQLMKLALDDTPLEVCRKHSSSRQIFGLTETTIGETSSDPPVTSLHHGDSTDDVIPRYHVPNQGDARTDSRQHRCDVTNADDRFRRAASPSLNGGSSDPSSIGRRIICKRKVMRKRGDGESAVFDESLVTDGDTSYRMHDVSMDDMSVNYDRVHMPPTLPPRPHTARPGMRKLQDLESIQEQPLPSYIRPNTSHPHTRNLRKTDPVNRYHQYRDAWDSIKAPGERNHNALRWEVKAQMMYKDEPQPRTQRVFVPNTYVVPTSKKRAALRWEVRHALERGLPVPSTFTVM